MAQPEPKEAPRDDTAQTDFEAATDEAIALCGGNVRAALTALLIVNCYLERELEQAKVAVSNGYSRGRNARRCESK